MYQQILRQTPDAIMADWDLPTLSGADLVRDLHNHPDTKSMPLAVVTKSGEEAIAKECKEAGASLVVEPSTPKSHVSAWFNRVLADYEELHRPPTLDRNMATSISSATQEVMATLLGVDLAPGKLKIEKSKPQRADVIGSITVDGYVTGTITLFMSLKLARVFAQRMLGEVGKEPTDAEIVDAVGEMTNMIAGNIKTRLCQREELFRMSSPSVVLGREVRRVSLDKNLAFLQPWKWHSETLLVEFSLAPRRKEPGLASSGVRSAVD
jgi:chemotaxis protein CheX